MDDTTIDHPSEEPNSDQRRGLSRRQVSIAAAWALPVIAAATAAPLAAASPNSPNTQKYIAMGGNVGTTGPTTLEGSFTIGELRYSDFHTGTWPSGPLTITASMTSNPSGALSNVVFMNPLTSNPYTVNEIVTIGGVAWTVTSVDATSVSFTALSQTLTGPGLTIIGFPLPDITADITASANVTLAYHGTFPGIGLDTTSSQNIQVNV